MTDIIRRELAHKDAHGVPQKRAVARKLIDLALARGCSYGLKHHVAEVSKVIEAGKGT
jgi:hypothetical protein